jgi:hypothetical protein
VRPLLGVQLREPDPDSGMAVEPGEVWEELAHHAEDRWHGLVELVMLNTEDELKAFQAGHLVLYRKPVRRRAPTDVSYRRPDGTVVEREQTTLFGEPDEPT